MLQVKQKVDVVCSAIGIKEAVGMLPFTRCICDAIKDDHDTSLYLTHEQCITIGRILGELGFVNDIGENPLELIQALETKDLESDIAAQLEQSIDEQGIVEQCPECSECPE